jgi:ABC-2 type transport system ATP-binding protein
VRWTHEGEHFVYSTHESTKFAFDLFKQYGEAIADLEVRRSSLEDTYLALVKQAESPAVQVAR